LPPPPLLLLLLLLLLQCCCLLLLLSPAHQNAVQLLAEGLQRAALQGSRAADQMRVRRR
jgi:hypothetical protein